MKTKMTISILIVIAIRLILHQSAVAQKTEDLIPNNVPGEGSEVLNGGNQLLAQKTQALMSNTVLGNGGEILSDGNQLFLVNVGKPAIV